VLVSFLILPVPRAALACLGCAFPLRGHGAARVWFVSGVRRGWVPASSPALSPDPNPSLRCFVRSPYGIPTPLRRGWAVCFRFQRCSEDSISRRCCRIVCRGVGDLWCVCVERPRVRASLRWHG
jgi:hypothetical protein